MSGQDVHSLLLQALIMLKNGYLMGWVVVLIIAIAWHSHVKILNKRHDKQNSILVKEKAKLQNQKIKIDLDTTN
jgi:hypothetical protein